MNQITDITRTGQVQKIEGLAQTFAQTLLSGYGLMLGRQRHKSLPVRSYTNDKVENVNVEGRQKKEEEEAGPFNRLVSVVNVLGEEQVPRPGQSGGVQAVAASRG